MKRRILMTLVLTGCLALAGCGSSASTTSTTTASSEKSTQDSGASAGQDAKKVTIKFGNTAGEDDIQTMALREVAKRLSEESGGRIEAEIYPSSSLGDTDDLTEQAMQGAAILTVSDPSRLASFVNDYGMLQMPYIFDDYTGLDKVMETELYAQWEKEFADQGIWLVTSNWFSGTRNFCLNKEVNVPADLN